MFPSRSPQTPHASEKPEVSNLKSSTCAHVVPASVLFQTSHPPRGLPWGKGPADGPLSMLHIAVGSAEKYCGIVLNEPSPPVCLRTTQRCSVVVVGGLPGRPGIVTVNGSLAIAYTLPAASI